MYGSAMICSRDTPDIHKFIRYKEGIGFPEKRREEWLTKVSNLSYTYKMWNEHLVPLLSNVRKIQDHKAPQSNCVISCEQSILLFKTINQSCHFLIASNF